MDIGLTIGSLIAIILLGWFAGRLFPVTRLLDDERVRRNLLRYEPDVQIDGILISDDGLTALVALVTPAHSIGLLHQLGDRVVCRIITAGDIAHVYTDHARLSLSFHDFTQPEVTLVFADSHALANAQALVDTMISAEDHAHAA